MGRAGVWVTFLNNLPCTAVSACQFAHNGKASAGNVLNSLLVAVRITTREDTRGENRTQEKEAWDGDGALLVDEIGADYLFDPGSTKGTATDNVLGRRTELSGQKLYARDAPGGWGLFLS